MPSHNCKDVSEAKRSFRMTCRNGGVFVHRYHGGANRARCRQRAPNPGRDSARHSCRRRDGFRPIAKPASWLEAIGVIVLLLFAISWLSTAHGLLSKSPATAGRVTIIPVFLPYLSSAFVPTKTMLVWCNLHCELINNPDR
jgi:hypothetical protein